MEPLNAITSEPMSATVSRIRSKFAATGRIEMADYRTVFGDPMGSVSFGQMRDQVTRDGEAARLSLGNFQLIEGAASPIKQS